MFDLDKMISRCPKKLEHLPASMLPTIWGSCRLEKPLKHVARLFVGVKRRKEEQRLREL